MNNKFAHSSKDSLPVRNPLHSNKKKVYFKHKLTKPQGEKKNKQKNCLAATGM